jgi:hypothetical protein
MIWFFSQVAGRGRKVPSSGCGSPSTVIFRYGKNLPGTVKLIASLLGVIAALRGSESQRECDMEGGYPHGQVYAQSSRGLGQI